MLTDFKFVDCQCIYLVGDNLERFSFCISVHIIHNVELIISL